MKNYFYFLKVTTAYTHAQTPVQEPTIAKIKHNCSRERHLVGYTARLILFQVTHRSLSEGTKNKIFFYPMILMAIFVIVLQQQQQNHWKAVLNSKLKHAYSKRQLFKLPSH